jgi:putative membrane protein
MRHTLLAFVVPVGLFASAAWAADTDADFVQETANVGMLEVELGRYATQHAADPAVRGFAQLMVSDHGKANAELAAIAKRHGLAVPAGMDEKHRAELEKLTELRGTEFDEAYMDQMVDGHEHTLEAFQEQAEEGRSEVDRFAARTLPTLKEHLGQARAIRDSLDRHAGAADSAGDPR